MGRDGEIGLLEVNKNMRVVVVLFLILLKDDLFLV